MDKSIYKLIFLISVLLILLPSCSSNNGINNTAAGDLQTAEYTERTEAIPVAANTEKVIEPPIEETESSAPETNTEAEPVDLEELITGEPINTPAAKAASFLEGMSVDEKIGQLFFCAFRKDNAGNAITELTKNTENTVKNYGIGGIVMFSENIVSEPQITEYIRDLQSLSEIPLFIGIDEEGGRVARTGKLDVPKIDAALNIGNTGDVQNAYKAAETIASYLKPLGFNVDFAPVADVFTNSQNTVIGNRSFSSDAQIAANMVSEFVRGLNDNGLSSAIKHFPGHGDTSEDSHYEIAMTDKTLEQLEECELIPFISGIEAGTNFVMAGHISAPNITGSNGPSIFSGFLLQDILREKMGFDKIIITDALDMGAVTKCFTKAEIAVNSVLAGVDMLLMPQDLEAAISAVKEALDSGIISIERLNESVLRILTVKYEMGLMDNV